MAGSALAFESNRIGINQVLAVKPGTRGTAGCRVLGKVSSGAVRLSRAAEQVQWVVLPEAVRSTTPPTISTMPPMPTALMCSWKKITPSTAIAVVPTADQMA